MNGQDYQHFGSRQGQTNNVHRPASVHDGMCCISNPDRWFSSLEQQYPDFSATYNPHQPKPIHIFSSQEIQPQYPYFLKTYHQPQPTSYDAFSSQETETQYACFPATYNQPLPIQYESFSSQAIETQYACVSATYNQPQPISYDPFGSQDIEPQYACVSATSDQPQPISYDPFGSQDIEPQHRYFPAAYNPPQYSNRDSRGQRIRIDPDAATNLARYHEPLSQIQNNISASTQSYIPSFPGYHPSSHAPISSSIQGSGFTIGGDHHGIILEDIDAATVMTRFSKTYELAENAGSHSNGKKGVQRQPGNSYLPQGLDVANPPYGPESDQGYGIGRTSSYNQFGSNYLSSSQTLALGQDLMSHDSGTAVPFTRNASDNARNEGGRLSSVQTPATGQSEKGLPTKKADKKPKGQVRHVRGSMEHREADGDIWKPAVYHEELRDILIAEASLLGAYDHPRERGIAVNDVTSFLPSQKEWGPDRDIDWPKVENNVLHRFERQGYPIPDYKPEVWYHAGRIVLDMDNNAILKYKVIPATLSSELSGRDMEAMERLDLRISRKDFRARMPSTILTKDKNKPQRIKPVYTLSALGMRTARFRQENGLISWTKREGGANIRKSLLRRMPQANIAANSTQGMPFLTLFEQEDARKANKGQYPNRAGRRALSENARVERAEKEQQRMEKFYTADIEAENKAAMRSGGKRKREVGLSTTEEELQRIKRVRQDLAQQTSESISDSTLLLEFAPLSDFMPQYRVHPVSEPPTRGRKRSREELSTNDDEDLELPSKLLKVQPVDAHSTLIYTRPMPANDEPTANFINRPKALMPRLSHRRCKNKVVGITSGDRLPSSTHQIRPQASLSHQSEENRLDKFAAFNVEEPSLEEAPEQNVLSVETRLEAALTGWLAQQHEDVVESTSGDTADPKNLDTPGYSFSGAAPPLPEGVDQKTKDFDESSFLLAQISNDTTQLEDQGLDPASLDELFGVDTNLNSTFSNSFEEDSEPQDKMQQTTTAVPVQGQPEVCLTETEDDLHSLFGSEDEDES